MIGATLRYARDVLRLELQRTALARVEMTAGLAGELREAARAFHHGDREAYDRVKSLTGTTFEGKRIRFRPSDVWCRPLNDANGDLRGATYEHGGDRFGYSDLVRWVEQETRQADTEVVPKANGQYLPPEDAPWADAVRLSGRPPRYIFIHGGAIRGGDTGDHFLISVNRGADSNHESDTRNGSDPDWLSVYLNGPEGGELLEAHETSARLFGLNPADEQVLVACRTGKSATSAAPGAAEYLHSRGVVTGNIYAPTDVANTPIPERAGMPTELYVKRESPDRKLFETYSAPEPQSARPEDS
ncbi:hypothetical protein ACWCPQ_31190 [Nocardia sp. NPDC001965]